MFICLVQEHKLSVKTRASSENVAFNENSMDGRAETQMWWGDEDREGWHHTNIHSKYVSNTCLFLEKLLLVPVETRIHVFYQESLTLCVKYNTSEINISCLFIKLGTMQPSVSSSRASFQCIRDHSLAVLLLSRGCCKQIEIIPILYFQQPSYHMLTINQDYQFTTLAENSPLKNLFTTFSHAFCSKKSPPFHPAAALLTHCDVCPSYGCSSSPHPPSNCPIITARLWKNWEGGCRCSQCSAKGSWVGRGGKRWGCMPFPSPRPSRSLTDLVTFPKGTVPCRLSTESEEQVVLASYQFCMRNFLFWMTFHKNNLRLSYF